MRDRVLSATQACKQLRKQVATPQELKTQLLDEISRKDPKLRAFLFANNAVASSQSNTLLCGLPISVKDQFHVAGTPCSFGLEKRVQSETTAPVIENLLRQGATLLGKTSLPPLAMDFQTSNKLTGVCKNPWNTSYTSGGSSGGGAAAVASGMSYVDIGADLAGSLRIPASFCGVYSLMPSEGAVSNKGIFLDPKTTVSHFARPGPIVRTPEDLLLIWGAIIGSERSYIERKDENQPIRLAIWDEIEELPLDREIFVQMNEISSKWQESGVSLQRDKPSCFDFSDCWRLYGQIMGYETSGIMNPFIRWISILSGKTNRKLSPYFFSNVIRGYKRKKADYELALAQRQQIIQYAESFFEKYDAWVLPVTCSKVFNHMSPTSEKGPNREYHKPLSINNIDVNYLDALTAYTTPVSLIGHPVVTMPIGTDSNGLPIGVQVVGKMNDEHRLIAIVERLSKQIQMPVCPSLQN
ncbi:putative Amidase [Vibrio nigripulchritudo SOn1]|uniref:Amidase n=1 Tax=Vibrio nigripulchritudo SOn1 TaxID=1238450 RepID=A0AAV2VNW4_9VIBR|nr:amidase [Vibrio nigripulchritudo]CCO46337.1 putative Amidase [Vibrio nigripulchritudo SOn1]